LSVGSTGLQPPAPHKVALSIWHSCHMSGSSIAAACKRTARTSTVFMSAVMRSNERRRSQGNTRRAFNACDLVSLAGPNPTICMVWPRHGTISRPRQSNTSDEIIRKDPSVLSVLLPNAKESDCLNKPLAVRVVGRDLWRSDGSGRHAWRARRPSKGSTICPSRTGGSRQPGL
jgi:hypothetical protein